MTRATAIQKPMGRGADDATEASNRTAESGGEADAGDDGTEELE